LCSIMTLIQHPQIDMFHDFLLLSPVRLKAEYIEGTRILKVNIRGINN
jgi:hypothetical protein